MAKTQFLINAKTALDAVTAQEQGDPVVGEFTLTPQQQWQLLRYLAELTDHIDDLEARIEALEP